MGMYTYTKSSIKKYFEKYGKDFPRTEIEEHLDLNLHTYIYLYRAGYKNIEQLTNLEIEDLMLIPKICEKCAIDILSEVHYYERKKPLIEDNYRDKDGNLISEIQAKLKLSIRILNCLYRAGYIKIDQLKNLTPEDFMRIRNLGRKSYKELALELDKYYNTDKYSKEAGFIYYDNE